MASEDNANKRKLASDDNADKNQISSNDNVGKGQVSSGDNADKRHRDCKYESVVQMQGRKIESHQYNRKDVYVERTMQCRQ